jgi:hypothetical protein
VSYLLFMMADNFVQTPPDAVANHGRFIYLFANHNSQAVAGAAAIRRKPYRK